MQTQVLFHGHLRKYAQGHATLDLELKSGQTISDILVILEQKFSDLSAQLFDEKKELRKFVTIYLNDEDIRYLNGPQTVLKDRDVISLIPSISGG